ncbi:MAG: hypothetical protein ACTHMI_11545 [Mucilaginibacter sp.]
MANITLLHWNIETFGNVTLTSPNAKYSVTNGPHYVTYFAQLVQNTNANIFCMVEVKNNLSGILPGAVITQLNAVQGFNAGNTPWRSVTIDSGKNNEAYIVLYRTDQNFRPVRVDAAGTITTGPNVAPINALGTHTAAGGGLQFPAAQTKTGGRRPFVVTFRTTDTNNNFSVISYHAQFGNATANGILRLPSLNYITQFDNSPTYTAIEGSLISGDFNIDYVGPNHAYYANMLGLPSTNAVNANTVLKNNPNNSNNPADFLVSSYDNIFQKIPVGGVANAGAVIDLMVESAHVPGPQPAPPAAQAGVGNLSAAAANFDIPTINALGFTIQNPIAALPPDDMNTAWDFVRKAISNHYPVVVTTTI